MNFCRHCGVSLAVSGPPAAVPSSLSELHTCRRCGGQTQSGFAFCQHCGAMLPTVPGSAPVRSGATPNPSGPSAPPPSASPSYSPAAVAPTLAQPGSHRAGSSPPVGPSPEAPWATLYSVKRDGSDGERFPLSGEWIEIGRHGADLSFEDRHLAARHARFERRGGQVVMVPLDSMNGVYRKIRGPHVIPDGTTILIGREVLRLDLVGDEERDVIPLVRRGVMLFGSPPRKPWARLTQLLANGVDRDVRHLHGPEVVLGREDGEIVFGDDEFLSRRHAILKWQGGQCVLDDLKSSNGTFVRLRGPQPLENGDVFRMGDQMFRLEIGAQ